jgi:serine protease
MELVAPGGDSSRDQNGDGYPDGILQMSLRTASSFGYYFYQGTSMASPHVAAVAALLISNGVTGPANIRQILRTTAKDLGSSGWDSESGYGLVDAQAALNTASSFSMNNPPIADAGGFYVGETGSSVQFDGSGSGDPDGDAINFLWNFGDGTTSTLEFPSHTFSTSGTYTVTLTVNDGDLESQNSTTAEITVQDSPEPDPTMVVSNINLTVIRDKNKVRGQAVVTVVDENGSPLSDATVNAHWSGVVSGTVTIVTDANGQATLISGKASQSSSSFVVTIDDVVKAGYTFDSNNSVLSESVAAQLSAGIMSVYPNPANPSATIDFQVNEPGNVEVIVYNMIGQQVRHLVSEYKYAGMYNVVWDGTNNTGSSVVSGIYFVTLEARNQMSTIRLMLAK